jgi:hypothetical protein
MTVDGIAWEICKASGMMLRAVRASVGLAVSLMYQDDHGRDFNNKDLLDIYSFCLSRNEIEFAHLRPKSHHEAHHNSLTATNR